MGLARVLAVVLAGVAAGGGCARRNADPLDDLLGRLSKQARFLRCFSMVFSEEKKLPGIGRPVVVNGTLWGKVDADGLWLRLEADFPRPSSILISPRDVRIFSPVERQCEIAPLERAPDFAGLVRGFFLLYGASREELERDFEIRLAEAEEGGRIEAQITPRSAAWPFLSGPLRVAWRASDAVLSEVRFATADGEEYRWIFTGHAYQGEPPGGFALHVPPGVQTVDLTELEGR